MSTPFDEAFEADGRLRPAYEVLRRRLGWHALRLPADASARLRERPLGDEARILPTPLVLEESEYGAIQVGVAQRACALQSFFRDAVLDDGRFLASGRGLAPPLLDEILAREGTSLARLRRAWGSHEPNEIRFVYGPDLARDPSGRWMVLEDNVGCVGGAADGFFVVDAYARATGQPPPTLETADLVRAVERWLGLLAHRSAGEPIFAILGCEPGGGDSAPPRLLENARRARLLGALGVESVGRSELRRLLRPGRARPGALVNFDHLAAHLVGKVFGRLRIPLLNSPGTALLGNKALLPFVGDMIRFFCEEEPLLATPSTRILRDGESLEPMTEWVVKTSTGAGGTGVFLPGSETTGRLEAVHALVRASGPCGVVAQRWVEPSKLSLAGPGARDAHRVELRPLTYVVGWEDVLVGEQPVGKAVSSFERPRLNNVSRGAAYVAVWRETSRPTAALGKGGTRSYDPRAASWIRPRLEGGVMALATMTEKKFPKEVLHHDDPVLVAFRARWCVPSQNLTPVIEEAAAEYKGRAKVVAVDVEGDPRANKICRQYEVSRLPVVMLFHEGRVKDLIGGETSKVMITDMLESQLKPVLDLGEQNFEAEVLRSPVPVIVHFRASWCKPSLELEPLVESLAETYRGRAKIARVEFGGDNARLCARYGVVRVPTLVLFQGGEVKDRILGAMTGGTKVPGGRQRSCVNRTSFENVGEMLEEFAL